MRAAVNFWGRKFTLVKKSARFMQATPIDPTPDCNRNRTYPNSSFLLCMTSFFFTFVNVLYTLLLSGTKITFIFLSKLFQWEHKHTHTDHGIIFGAREEKNHFFCTLFCFVFVQQPFDAMRIDSEWERTETVRKKLNWKGTAFAFGMTVWLYTLPRLREITCWKYEKSFEC